MFIVSLEGSSLFKLLLFSFVDESLPNHSQSSALFVYFEGVVENGLYNSKRLGMFKSDLILKIFLNRIFDINIYATYNNKNPIIKANKPIASVKANPKIA